jgi:hypothetical protein
VRVWAERETDGESQILAERVFDLTVPDSDPTQTAVARFVFLRKSNSVPGSERWDLIARVARTTYGPKQVSFDLLTPLASTAMTEQKSHRNSSGVTRTYGDVKIPKGQSAEELLAEINQSDTLSDADRNALLEELNLNDPIKAVGYGGHNASSRGGDFVQPEVDTLIYELKSMDLDLVGYDRICKKYGYTRKFAEPRFVVRIKCRLLSKEESGATPREAISE